MERHSVAVGQDRLMPSLEIGRWAVYWLPTVGRHSASYCLSITRTRASGVSLRSSFLIPCPQDSSRRGTLGLIRTPLGCAPRTHSVTQAGISCVDLPA